MSKTQKIRLDVPLVGSVLAATGYMLLDLAEQYGATLGGELEKQTTTGVLDRVMSTAMVDAVGAVRVAPAEFQATQDQPEDVVVYDSQAEHAVNPAAAFGGMTTTSAEPPLVDAGMAFGEKLADPAHLGPLNATIAPIDTGVPVGLQPGPVYFAPSTAPQDAPPTATPPTATPFPASTVELDNRGLPWDSRIHASTKTKCKTGEWKNARGVDPALLASVEAELKAAMSAGVPPVVAPQPVTPPVVAPQASQPITSAPPAIGPANPLGPTAAPTSFPEFLQIVTGKCAARLLSYDEVTKTVQKHLGPTAGIPTLNHRPELIPAVYAELEAIWLTRTPA